ncbi:protein transporter YIF1 [Ascoidea rubescens DSM 1968]|uniref:Protein YIF1 n=1 Tax=Ascoidea rubescens DSM 1968 TaxID=1344418 RepID=A0A1D2VP81_9ASCO|nr:YIF1-domain-containing protein [Ascoidea rubescens DSM 1968]ODV63409.1 YIF1-domain-containing protein [Ascoidea rubescens DSM 1968]
MYNNQNNILHPQPTHPALPTSSILMNQGLDQQTHQRNRSTNYQSPYLNQFANNQTAIPQAQPQFQGQFQSQQQQQLSQPQFQQQFQQQQQQTQQQSANINASASSQFMPNLFGNPLINESAMLAGKSYIDSNFKSYLQINSQTSDDLKYYFKVSNDYVLRKIFLILFPYKNKSWLRQMNQSIDSKGNKFDNFSSPIFDINAPDLYLPIMGYTTYIFLLAVISGLSGNFHPELFGYSSTKILIIQIIDFLILKLFLYLLNNESKNLDLVCYSNYKFIPLILILLLKQFLSVSSLSNTNLNSSIFSLTNIFYYLTILLLNFSFEFFLMRSLKYIFLGNGLVNNSAQTIQQKQRQRRIYFLFCYSFIVQMIIMFFLA